MASAMGFISAILFALFGRDYVVDQPDTLGLGRADHVAREDQLHRPAFADESR